LSTQNPPQPEPAVSKDLPQQASADAAPILEHAELPQPEPAVSKDLPQQASPDAGPILEHAELPPPEPAVSGICLRGPAPTPDRSSSTQNCRHPNRQ
jgi:hypothetical protein